jgi:hypothetical protein
LYLFLTDRLPQHEVADTSENPSRNYSWLGFLFFSQRRAAALEIRRCEAPKSPMGTVAN